MADQIEQFVAAGQRAQSAVDRVTQSPVYKQIPLNIPQPHLVAAACDKTDEWGRLKVQREKLQKEAEAIRKRMVKLEEESTALMREAVAAKENPMLPFDPASKAVAEQMLAGPDKQPVAMRMEVQIGTETRAATIVPDRGPIPLPVVEPNLVGPPLPPITEAERRALERPEKYRFAEPTVTIESGKGYALEDLGVDVDDLEHCMEGLRILPPAPDFPKEGTGHIGYPMQIDPGEWWAVIHARNWIGEWTGERGPVVTYTLHPLHKAEEWADKVQTHLQRFDDYGKDANEDVPLKGVRVQDPSGEEWILGADDERVTVTAERVERRVVLPPAQQPDAPYPDVYPEALAEDEGYARRWYQALSDALEDGAPELTGTRFDTLMDLPTWCRHLMLDPRLNDFGVRQAPDRKRIHTIPKSIGTGEVLLFEDRDGKWWSESNYAMKNASGGGLPGPRRSCKPTDRQDTAYDALLDALASLRRIAMGRANDDTAEGRVAKRYVAAVDAFRAEAQKVFDRSTATVKHTPPRAAKEDLCEILHGGQKPKAKPLAGRRSVHGGTDHKDSFEAWYGHFKATLKPLVPDGEDEEAADPWIFDQGGKVRVGGQMLGPANHARHLYERYRSENLTPSDAAREFAAARFGKQDKHKAAAADKHRSLKAAKKGKRPSASPLSLAQFVAGLKGGLPAAMKPRIQYDKSLNGAAVEVMKLYHQRIPVREAIAALKEQWA